jgi:hypothetical protein
MLIFQVCLGRLTLGRWLVSSRGRTNPHCRQSILCTGAALPGDGAADLGAVVTREVGAVGKGAAVPAMKAANTRQTWLATKHTFPQA